MKAKNKFLSVLSDLESDAAHSFNYWKHNLMGNRVEKKRFSGKSSHHPVILVHGFMSSRGVLHPLEKYLRLHGRDVLSINLGVLNVQDIRKSARFLSYKIEKIMDRYCKIHDFEKVDIIGHSMGALIGLYYIKHLGGHRVVNKLITLGAPFSGTWSSLLAIFPFGLFSKGVWQMIPRSPFLKKLQAKPRRAHETKIISIAAKYDAICPPSSCHLKGAVNHVIPIGHSGLLMDKKVFQDILTFLDDKKDAPSVESRQSSIKTPEKTSQTK